MDSLLFLSSLSQPSDWSEGAVTKGNLLILNLTKNLFWNLTDSRTAFIHLFVCLSVDWESDLATILLLLHLLPPTSKGKKHKKISASEAGDHLVKFLKVRWMFKE